MLNKLINEPSSISFTSKSNIISKFRNKINYKLLLLVLMTNKVNFSNNVILSVLLNIVAIISGIFTLPLSIRYFSKEIYGSWALISTILTYLSVSNFGLTQTSLFLITKNKDDATKILIFLRTTKLLLLISVLLLVIFNLVIFFYPNSLSVIGYVSLNSRSQVYTALFWSIFIYFINLPLSNFSSLLIGSQKFHVEKIFQILTIIINFLILLFVVNNKLNIIFYAVLIAIAPIIFNITKFIYLYILFEGFKNSNYEFNIDSQFKTLTSTSFKYFIAGFATLVIWNTDNLVISHFLGISNVTPYSIVFKIYSLLFSLVYIFTGSLVPIIGKEFGEKNWEWLKISYQVGSTFTLFFGGLIWVGGMFFMKDLIIVISTSSNFGGNLLVFALGGYFYVLTFMNFNTSILNSINYISKQVIVTWVEALVNLILSLFLLQYFGIAGVGLGTFISATITSFWTGPLLLRQGTNYQLNINSMFLIKHFVLVIVPILVISIFTNIYIQRLVLRIGIGIIFTFIYFIFSFYLIPKNIQNEIMQIINLFSRRKFFEK